LQLQQQQGSGTYRQVTLQGCLVLPQQAV
jgi:hypothetical protein